MCGGVCKRKRGRWIGTKGREGERKKRSEKKAKERLSRREGREGGKEGREGEGGKARGGCSAQGCWQNAGFPLFNVV